MIAFALLLTLGQAGDAGIDGGSLDAGAPVEQLYTACASDVPLATEIDGGIDEPWARVKYNNCKMSACENYANDKLVEPQTSVGTVLGLTAGGIVIAVIGIIVGLFIPHPTK